MRMPVPVRMTMIVSVTMFRVIVMVFVVVRHNAPAICDEIHANKPIPRSRRKTIPGKNPSLWG